MTINQGTKVTIGLLSAAGAIVFGAGAIYNQVDSQSKTIANLEVKVDAQSQKIAELDKKIDKILFINKISFSSSTYELSQR